MVDDVERSKNFYCHLFGLRVVTDFGGNVILTEGLVLQERKMWDGLIGESSISGGNDVELYYDGDYIGEIKCYTIYDDVNLYEELKNGDFGKVVDTCFTTLGYVDEKRKEIEYMVPGLRCIVEQWSLGVGYYFFELHIFELGAFDEFV